MSGASAYWLAILWVRIFSPDWIFDGFKIRDESADSAWQTIRLFEMDVVGPTSLWWEHIYPPLYDGIRFLLMQPETLHGGSPNVLAVDFRLYILNSILFGATAMIVYLWTRDLTHNGWWAAAGAALWTAVPASLAFFVLLYQTGLAIAAMALAFFLLFRFCRTRQYAYSAGFLLALLLASLTRNVVQVHVLFMLVIAAFALWWIARGRRAWMLSVNLLLVALLAFWPMRALVLYGTFDVSSHTGYNRAGALWINPLDVPEYVPREVKDTYQAYEAARVSLDDPAQLATKTPEEILAAREEFLALEQAWNGMKGEYSGIDIASAGVYPDQLLENATRLTSNWNNQTTLRDNYRLGDVTNRYILTQPIDATAAAVRSLGVTVPTMFRSVYVQWYNGFNYTFAPMRALDWVFFGWRFVALIAFTVIVMLAHFGMRGIAIRIRRYGWFAVFWLLTTIPVLLSNRYWPAEIPQPTHSEADRLRGLIDIPFYVLFAFACYLTIGWIRQRETRLSRRKSTDSSNEKSRPKS
jgi:hypothetical protein